MRQPKMVSKRQSPPFPKLGPDWEFGSLGPWRSSALSFVLSGALFVCEMQFLWRSG